MNLAKVVRVLLNHGADCAVRLNNGLTVEDIATANPGSEATKVLRLFEGAKHDYRLPSNEQAKVQAAWKDL